MAQINAGADALDLTDVRAQSELYLDALVSVNGVREQAIAATMRSPHEVGAQTIERAVEARVNLLRSEDALLPQRLTISEPGVERTVDKAIQHALLVSSVVDLAAVALIAIVRGLARAAAPRRLSETGFDARDFQLTDAMNDKQFTRLIKSVRGNGFTNPVIKYAMVDGKPAILLGNNRFQAAKHLGRVDELRFQDVRDAMGEVRLPKYRGN